MTTAEHPDVGWLEMTAVGITYRQLDWWVRAGYLVARDGTPGSGRQRRFPTSEVPVAAVMARLVAAGLPPADAERVARGNPLGPGIEISVDGLAVDEYRAAYPLPGIGAVETSRGEGRPASRCGQEDGGEPAEFGPPPVPESLLEHRDLPPLTKLERAHISTRIDPRLPDTGSICCYGVANYGPGGCTCWEAVYDLEQQPADEQMRDWLAAGVQPNTRDRMCDACAYRPGSPEKQGIEDHASDAESLEQLAADGDRFWCHAGMRRPAVLRHPSGAEIPGHPAAYAPLVVDGIPYQADGQPGQLCAGWAARARALGGIPR